MVVPDHFLWWDGRLSSLIDLFSLTSRFLVRDNSENLYFRGLELCDFSFLVLFIFCNFHYRFHHARPIVQWCSLITIWLELFSSLAMSEINVISWVINMFLFLFFYCKYKTVVLDTISFRHYLFIYLYF